MSAPVSKSEAAELHQHIAALYADAVTKGKQDAVTLRTLREGLVARGFLAAEDAEQWKTTWKEHVKVEFQRLFDEPEAQSEHKEVELKVKKPKKSPKKSSKYDRAAEKSLSNFMGMVAGDLLGGDDDEDDEDDSAMDSASASGDGGASHRSASASMHEVVDDYFSSDPGSAEVELGGKTSKGKKRPSSSTVDKSKKRAPKKRKKASPKGGKKFKSKETISDSDASGEESGSTRKASGSAGQSGGESSGEEDEEVEVKGGLKSTGKSKEKGPRKSEERKLKEGDEPRGTEQEEDRIRQLKALLVLAGVLRPFSRTTGAERTLTVSARLDRLEGLLVELGLPCGKGVGTKMPSEAKAKEVGTARALEQEVKEISGWHQTTGLRDGKKRVGKGEEDEKPAVKKPFGAFLNAVQSSSDSD